MQKEKVIIIGGGPSGLGAAIYNARAFLNPLVIAGAPPGGQLTLTSDVENYPGILSILGPDLIMKMREHAAHFETRFVDDNVKEVDFSDPKNLMIKVSGGQEYSAESVLITTGASAKWLGIESETRLRGRGVSACATCDGFFFRDKVVAVVGGGDTAMEEAATLTRFAKKVYILHRKEEFRASQIMQKRVIDNEKIEVLWGTEVSEVLGEQKVEGLKLNFTTDSSKEKVEGDILKVDGLFLAIGHTPNTDFLKDSGVAMNEKGYITTSAWFAWEKAQGRHKDSNLQFDMDWQYATSKEGVFAAGDCVDYLYRQGITATGMGAAAALEVERYLAEID
ncbi:FAD-dependent oxidoreductase [Candidatus Woesebacteria bacterium]|nr:FAD-dependent oxidoreductase [Candidatus Woesebacteria bacterium]